MALLRHWTPSTVALLVSLSTLSRTFTAASVEAAPSKATARRGRGAPGSGLLLGLWGRCRDIAVKLEAAQPWGRGDRWST